MKRDDPTFEIERDYYDEQCKREPEQFPCADIEVDCLGHTPAQAAAFDAMCAAHDDYFWPHKNGCPLCGSDAYVGFSTVECSMLSCTNFVWKRGM